ncbi:Transcriptional regulator, contains XRE-family HTH domain [Devosia enhydra]|uniref:Transcriptional regulator, contains XRE-family HTH domain n=1 Tax=Devosia enhydra TaxID=665118 RepID=A0A1K2HVV4_9HYPH|nr:helix-turn-helix transcriptional regulator [Devosia enhydra]SFZ82955.1 Transcriptional regulator, contains XRE-family HTH domain [Devosia enhydra]
MNTDIGAALRAYRIGRGIRQAALAQSLGVAQSQVSRWESGREQPRAENLEAVRTLIWGEAGDPLAALRHFVSTSEQSLLLIDKDHRIIAKSRALAGDPSPLQQFGWVLDPAENPGFEPLYARYRAILADPCGIIGLEFELPFMLGGSPWLARVRKTIYRVAGVSVCLAELSFQPRPAGLSHTPRCVEHQLAAAPFADPEPRSDRIARLPMRKTRAYFGTGPAGVGSRMR